MSIHLNPLEKVVLLFPNNLFQIIFSLSTVTDGSKNNYKNCLFQFKKDSEKKPFVAVLSHTNPV